MSRPLRIEFPDALYHVTARGDRREAIVEDDDDRQMFLSILAQVVGQCNWTCYAWCLMDNHYHLLMQTPDANLSKGMRQLNGVYTQASNRRHRRVGHLFQGRFKAILVDSDAYLLELSRYVVLNPVRAGMVSHPANWPWSSYCAGMGLAPALPWMATDGLLAQFARRRSVARQRYAQFVMEGIKAAAQCPAGKDDVQIPFAQRRPPARPLAAIADAAPDRESAILAAHATGAYSYQQIATHFGIHFTTVGRIVRSAKNENAS